MISGPFDAGVVRGCIPVLLEPQDSAGTPGTLPGPEDVTITCGSVVTQYPDSTCDGGPGPAIMVDGGPAVTGLMATSVGTFSCGAVGTPTQAAFKPSTFGLTARSRLVLALTDGGSVLQKNSCTPLFLRSVDVGSGAVVQTATANALVTAVGPWLSASSSCLTLDSGVAVTLLASNDHGQLWVKADVSVPGVDGGPMDLQATSTSSLLLDGTSTFSVTCIPSGTTCGGTPGGCCNTCNSGTNTCT